MILENKSYKIVKESGEKSFGLLLVFIFIAIYLYPLLNNGNLKPWSLLIAIIIYLILLFQPKLLIFPNKFFIKLGKLINSLMSPFILSVFFFLIVTPTGIIMRLFGKDLSNQKKNISKKKLLDQKRKLNKFYE